MQCDGKNFSRRKTCYKCNKNKTINAKIIPVVKQRSVTLPSAFDASMQAAKFYNEALINGGSAPVQQVKAQHLAAL